MPVDDYIAAKIDRQKNNLYGSREAARKSRDRSTPVKSELVVKDGDVLIGVEKEMKLQSENKNQKDAKKG